MLKYENEKFGLCLHFIKNIFTVKYTAGIKYRITNVCNYQFPIMKNDGNDLNLESLYIGY